MHLFCLISFFGLLSVQEGVLRFFVCKIEVQGADFMRGCVIQNLGHETPKPTFCFEVSLSCFQLPSSRASCTSSILSWTVSLDAGVKGILNWLPAQSSRLYWYLGIANRVRHLSGWAKLSSSTWSLQSLGTGSLAQISPLNGPLVLLLRHYFLRLQW